VIVGSGRFAFGVGWVVCAAACGGSDIPDAGDETSTGTYVSSGISPDASTTSAGTTAAATTLSSGTSGVAESDATSETSTSAHGSSSDSSSSSGNTSADSDEDSEAGAGTNAILIDRCELLACPENAACVDDPARPYCACQPGFFPNNGSCVDRVLFALPMENPDGSLISGVIGFDNDPEVGSSDLDCTNYQGLPFPACYDDHSGTDFILAGGFETMDEQGSAFVYAAAEGEVVLVHDGEFDHCALNVLTFEVECENGGPVTPPNRVHVQHADGTTTRYLHLMQNSILVAEGDHVQCGQPLALVGSSGNSSGPHLHFTVFDAAGETVDPYTGPASQPETYWVEQDGAFGVPGTACQ
jgi:hypothetical protein